MTHYPFDQLIRTVKRYGADFVEVYAEQTHKTLVSCDDKRLDQIISSGEEGIGIRAMLCGHVAYGSTTDTSKKAVLELAKNVAKSLSGKRRRTNPLTFTQRKPENIISIKRHPSGMSLDEKCAVVLRANEVAWASGSEIAQVKINYRDIVRKIWIANSENIMTNDEQSDLVFSAHAIASDGIVVQTGYETRAGACGFEIFDEITPEEIAEHAAKRAIKMLSARPAPAGQMTVILSSEAGGTMIHEAVGHGLEADLACEGLSVYAGKLGAGVASELISVVDDATLQGKRGSFTFDDEGEAGHRTLLIENGILKSYLVDKKTAMKTGLKETGNGRRQSFEYPPIARMTNTIILPGKSDPAMILKETHSGLFVRKMGGGQVNTINGDFVFDVQEAYLIDNGKLAEPVRGAMLIGNGPKILSAIDRVGSDLGFSVGTCGKEGQDVPVSSAQPTIRIPEMVVGGTGK